jgi:Tfp pilus assembly major pilin PilA
MKKAKILLMILAVIATVGTALAFKVVNKGTLRYCYLTTTLQPGTGECTSEAVHLSATSGATVFFYTQKTAACNTLECPKEGNSWVE